MKSLCMAAIVGVSLTVGLRADDKPKVDAPAAATQTPAQQIAAIETEFETAYQKVVADFRTAKGDERDKVRERAFQLAPDFAKKMMVVVDANPNDPAVVRGLLWIASVSQKKGVPPPPQAKDALDRIVRDHLANPGIGELCGALESRPDGEKILRQIREKNASKNVKALAAMSLATLLSDEEKKPTPKQLEEAEKLLALGIAEAKAIKDFPEERIREAEGNLFEMRNLSVGKTAPEMESVDLEGKKVRLSDYKGKVVILDIWTTWCGPCRAMIPHERELVKKLEGKPFALISISGDAEKDAVTKFLEKEPMPWTHWWAGARGGVLEKWNVKFFPTIYVIDAKGTIRYKHVRDKDMDEAVDKLLKEAEEKK